MTALPPVDDPQLQRMEQATLWLQRMHAGADDERVVEAWLDWCQRDPLNQQAFDELAAVWELSGQLAAPQASRAAPRMPRPRRYALAASLGAVLVSAIAGSWWVNRPVQQDVVASELASPTGINTVTTLADGSLLELGGGTRVTVELGPRERRVRLHEGELYVTVRKDASRPFSVDAGLLEAIATGTAFNVLLTEERTTVTVAEGSVDALYEGQAAATPNMRVKSSQQLVYSHASHSAEVRATDPQRAIAWRAGKLHYDNEPLSEVIATVNRYADKRILIADPRLGAMGYIGTVHLDNIGGFLKGLPDVFQVSVVRLSDGRQQIAARPGALPD
jgi:transmembrane sensor